jgi:hypothetical protein
MPMVWWGVKGFLFTHDCGFILPGDQCIAHVVCVSVKIHASKWNLFKELVRDNIRIKRNNCNMALKKEFLGKVVAWLVDEERNKNECTNNPPF